VIANTKLECYSLKRNLSNDVITTLISRIVIEIITFYKIKFNAIMVVHDGNEQKPGAVYRECPLGGHGTLPRAPQKCQGTVALHYPNCHWLFEKS